MVAESESTHAHPPPKQNQLCRVHLLDGKTLELSLDKRCKGKVIFSQVVEHLNLLEKDYFGLSFREEDDAHVWLQLDKRVNKQLGNGIPWVFFFEIKFYPPDPAELTEELTRYLLTMHIRNDIASGKLPCSFITYAHLGSLLVQAQCGDYDPAEHGQGTEYIRDFPFAPEPTDPLLMEKVAELHRSNELRGMTSTECERQYLESARQLALYGVERHPAKDSQGTDIWLGVCASGILVYHDRLRVNRFPWPKIMKVSFRRNIFYIKLCPGEFEQTESTVGFRLASLKAAKRLWKSAVEHHAFFRLMSPDVPAEKKSVMPRFGSTNFRYSGRTQYQTRLASSLIDRQQPQFARSMSTRLPTASSYSIIDNGVSSSVPLSRSAGPLAHQGIEERPYSPRSEAALLVDTFPAQYAAMHGAGDSMPASAMIHVDPTENYGSPRAVGGSEGTPAGAVGITCLYVLHQEQSGDLGAAPAPACYFGTRSQLAPGVVYLCPHGHDRWHRACIYHPRRTRHDRAYRGAYWLEREIVVTEEGYYVETTTVTTTMKVVRSVSNYVEPDQDSFAAGAEKRQLESRARSDSASSGSITSSSSSESSSSSDTDSEAESGMPIRKRRTIRKFEKILERRNARLEALKAAGLEHRPRPVYQPPDLPRYKKHIESVKYYDPSRPYYVVTMGRYSEPAPRLGDKAFGGRYSTEMVTSEYDINRDIKDVKLQSSFQRSVSPGEVTASAHSVTFAPSDRQDASSVSSATKAAPLCGPFRRNRREKSELADMDYYYSGRYEPPPSASVTYGSSADGDMSFPESVHLSMLEQLELQDPTLPYDSAEASFYPSHLDESTSSKSAPRGRGSKSRMSSGICSPFACMQGRRGGSLPPHGKPVEREEYMVNTWQGDPDDVPRLILNQFHMDQTRNYVQAKRVVETFSTPVMKTPEFVKKTLKEPEFVTSTPVVDVQVRQPELSFSQDVSFIKETSPKSVVANVTRSEEIDFSFLENATFIAPAVPPAVIHDISHSDPTAGISIQPVKAYAHVARKEVEGPVFKEPEIVVKQTRAFTEPPPAPEVRTPPPDTDTVMPDQNDRRSPANFLCGPFCGMIADKNKSDAYNVSGTVGPNTFMAPMMPPSKTYQLAYADPTEKYMAPPGVTLKKDPHPVYLTQPLSGRKLKFKPNLSLSQKPKKPEFSCAPCLPAKGKLKKGDAPFEKRMTYIPPEQAPVESYQSGYYDPTCPYTLARQVEQAARLFEAQYGNANRKLDFRRGSVSTIASVVNKKAKKPGLDFSCASCIASKQKKLASVPESKPYGSKTDIYLASVLPPPKEVQQGRYYDPTLPFKDATDLHIEVEPRARKLEFKPAEIAPSPVPGKPAAPEKKKAKSPTLICAPCRGAKRKPVTAEEIPYEQPREAASAHHGDPSAVYSREDVEIEIKHPHVTSIPPPRLQLRAASVDSVDHRAAKKNYAWEVGLPLPCGACGSGKKAKRVTAEEIPYVKPQALDVSGHADPTATYEREDVEIEVKHPHVTAEPPRQFQVRAQSVESVQKKKGGVCAPCVGGRKAKTPDAEAGRPVKRTQDAKVKPKGPSLICAPCLGARKPKRVTAEDIPYEKPRQIHDAGHGDPTGVYYNEEVEIETKHPHVSAAPPPRLEMKAPSVESVPEKRAHRGNYAWDVGLPLPCAACGASKKAKRVTAEEIPYEKPHAIDVSGHGDPTALYEVETEVKHAHVTAAPPPKLQLRAPSVESVQKAKGGVCAPCTGGRKAKPTKAEATSDDRAAKPKAKSPSLICVPCRGAKKPKHVTAEDIPYERPSTVHDAGHHDPSALYHHDDVEIEVKHPVIAATAPPRLQLRAPSVDSVPEKHAKRGNYAWEVGLPLPCTACGGGRKAKHVTADEIPYEKPSAIDVSGYADPTATYEYENVEVKHPHTTTAAPRPLEIRSPSVESIPKKSAGGICAPCGVGKARKKTPDVSVAEKTKPKSRGTEAKAKSPSLICAPCRGTKKQRHVTAEDIPYSLPERTVTAGYHDPTTAYHHDEVKLEVKHPHISAAGPPPLALRAPSVDSAIDKAAKRKTYAWEVGLPLPCAACAGGKKAKRVTAEEIPYEKPRSVVQSDHGDPTGTYEREDIQLAVKHPHVSTAPPPRLEVRAASVESLPKKGGVCAPCASGRKAKPADSATKPVARDRADKVKSKTPSLVCAPCRAAKKPKQVTAQEIPYVKPGVTHDTGHHDPSGFYRHDEVELEVSHSHITEAAPPPLNLRAPSIESVPEKTARKNFAWEVGLPLPCAACGGGRKPRHVTAEEIPYEKPSSVDLSGHADPTGTYEREDIQLEVKHPHVSTAPPPRLEVRAASVESLPKKKSGVCAPCAGGRKARTAEPGAKPGALDRERKAKAKTPSLICAPCRTAKKPKQVTAQEIPYEKPGVTHDTGHHDPSGFYSHDEVELEVSHPHETTAPPPQLKMRAPSIESVPEKTARKNYAWEVGLPLPCAACGGGKKAKHVAAEGVPYEKPRSVDTSGHDDPTGTYEREDVQLEVKHPQVTAAPPPRLGVRAASEEILQEKKKAVDVKAKAKSPGLICAPCRGGKKARHVTAEEIPYDKPREILGSDYRDPTAVYHHDEVDLEAKYPHVAMSPPPRLELRAPSVDSVAVKPRASKNYAWEVGLPLSCAACGGKKKAKRVVAEEIPYEKPSVIHGAGYHDPTTVYHHDEVELEVKHPHEASSPPPRLELRAPSVDSVSEKPKAKQSGLVCAPCRGKRKYPDALRAYDQVDEFDLIESIPPGQVLPARHHDPTIPYRVAEGVEVAAKFEASDAQKLKVDFTRDPSWSPPPASQPRTETKEKPSGLGLACAPCFGSRRSKDTHSKPKKRPETFFVESAPRDAYISRRHDPTAVYEVTDSAQRVHETFTTKARPVVFRERTVSLTSQSISDVDTHDAKKRGAGLACAPCKSKKSKMVPTKKRIVTYEPPAAAPASFESARHHDPTSVYIVSDAVMYAAEVTGPPPKLALKQPLETSLEPPSPVEKKKGYAWEVGLPLPCASCGSGSKKKTKPRYPLVEPTFEAPTRAPTLQSGTTHVDPTLYYTVTEAVHYAAHTEAPAPVFFKERRASSRSASPPSETEANEPKKSSAGLTCGACRGKRQPKEVAHKVVKPQRITFEPPETAPEPLDVSHHDPTNVYATEVASAVLYSAHYEGPDRKIELRKAHSIDRSISDEGKGPKQKKTGGICAPCGVSGKRKRRAEEIDPFYPQKAPELTSSQSHYDPSMPFRVTSAGSEAAETTSAAAKKELAEKPMKSGGLICAPCAGGKKKHVKADVSTKKRIHMREPTFIPPAVAPPLSEPAGHYDPTEVYLVGEAVQYGAHVAAAPHCPAIRPRTVSVSSEDDVTEPYDIKPRSRGSSCAPCAGDRKSKSKSVTPPPVYETFVPPAEAPPSVRGGHFDPTGFYTPKEEVYVVHKASFEGPPPRLVFKPRTPSPETVRVVLTGKPEEPPPEKPQVVMAKREKERPKKSAGLACAPCAGRSKAKSTSGKPGKRIVETFAPPPKSQVPEAILAAGHEDPTAVYESQVHALQVAGPPPSIRRERSVSLTSLSISDVEEDEEPKHRGPACAPCRSGRKGRYDVDHYPPSGPLLADIQARPAKYYSGGHFDPTRPYTGVTVASARYVAPKKQEEVVVRHKTYQTAASAPKLRQRPYSGTTIDSTPDITEMEEPGRKGKKSGATCFPCGTGRSKSYDVSAGEEELAKSQGSPRAKRPTASSKTQRHGVVTFHPPDRAPDQIAPASYHDPTLPYARKDFEHPEELSHPTYVSEALPPRPLRLKQRVKSDSAPRSRSVSVSTDSDSSFYIADMDKKKPKKTGAWAPCGGGKKKKKRTVRTFDPPRELPRRLYKTHLYDPTKLYAPQRVDVVRYEHSYAGPPRTLALKPRVSRPHGRTGRAGGPRSATFRPPAQQPSTLSFMDHEDPTIPYKSRVGPVHETYTKTATRPYQRIIGERSPSPSLRSVSSDSGTSLSSSSLDSDVSDLSDFYNASLSIEGDFPKVQKQKKTGASKNPCICGTGKKKVPKDKKPKEKVKVEEIGIQEAVPTVGQPSKPGKVQLTVERDHAVKRRRSSSTVSSDSDDSYGGEREPPSARMRLSPQRSGATFKRRDTLPVNLIVLPTTIYLTDHIDPTIDSAEGTPAFTGQHGSYQRFTKQDSPVIHAVIGYPSQRSEQQPASFSTFGVTGSPVSSPVSGDESTRYYDVESAGYTLSSSASTRTATSPGMSPTGTYESTGSRTYTADMSSPEGTLTSNVRILGDAQEPYHEARELVGRVTRRQEPLSTNLDTLETTRVVTRAPTDRGSTSLRVVTRSGGGDGAYSTEEVTSSHIIGSTQTSYATAVVGRGGTGAGWSPAGTTTQRTYNWRTESSGVLGISSGVGADGGDFQKSPESADEGWTVTKSTLEQREQMGEPETETITETLPDGTVVTRTITKRRVVKQVISKQVIEAHGGEEYELGPDGQVISHRHVESPRAAIGGADDHHVHETATRSFVMTSPGSPTGSGGVQDGGSHADGKFVSSQSVTSDGRTVETITYETEKDGKTETHTEKRVVIHGEGINHDAALTAAILEATQMDPNVMVEKIEVSQQRQS